MGTRLWWTGGIVCKQCGSGGRAPGFGGGTCVMASSSSSTSSCASSPGAGRAPGQGRLDAQQRSTSDTTQPTMGRRSLCLIDTTGRRRIRGKGRVPNKKRQAARLGLSLSRMRPNAEGEEEGNAKANGGVFCDATKRCAGIHNATRSLSRRTKSTDQNRTGVLGQLVRAWRSSSSSKVGGCLCDVAM